MNFTYAKAKIVSNHRYIFKGGSVMFGQNFVFIKVYHLKVPKKFPHNLFTWYKQQNTIMAQTNIKNKAK